MSRSEGLSDDCAPLFLPPPQNDLEFFRLRGREVELLCAPSADFLVIVLQRWKPSGGSGGPGAGAGGGEAHADAAGGAAGGAAAPK